MGPGREHRDNKAGAESKNHAGDSRKKTIARAITAQD